MKTKLMLVGGAFIMFFIAAALNAQAPQLLNYQGKLVIDGKPVQTPTEITFTIFNAATGGTVLWTEKQVVQPNNGVFNVLLGSVNPLVNRLTNKGLFAEAGERHLAINVGNNPEIGKRIQITSVAYAIKSSQADKATTADTARVAQMAYSLNAATGTQTNAVFVDNNGDVGIGTNAPQNKLDIAGGLKVRGSSLQIGVNPVGMNLISTDAEGNLNLSPVNADKSVFIRDDNTQKGIRLFGGPVNTIQSVGLNGTTPDHLGIQPEGGNVGIGTTTPGLRLHVNGNADDIIQLSRDNQSPWIFGVGQAAVPGSFFIARPGSRDFNIASNGNVGIGTIDPKSKLHVAGGIRAQKGDALAGDESNIGYTFEGDGDTGLFAVGGNPGAGSALVFRLDNIEGMRIGRVGLTSSDIRVGIGKIADPQFALDVNGAVRGIGAFDQTSDLRYKKNLAPIPNAIDKITRLRGVSFDWRQEEFSELNFNKGKNFGFIAQEIKEVLPEVVSQDSKGYYSVAYSNVVPVLVEAIKEQQQTIAQLQTQLQKNEAELAGFKEKMNRIEAALQKLNEKTDRSLAATGQ